MRERERMYEREREREIMYERKKECMRQRDNV